MYSNQIVGIDFSKETFDSHIYLNGKYAQFQNNCCGFKKFIVWLKKNVPVGLGQIMVVLEHTGHYSYLFEQFMYDQQIVFCKIPALQIKRSMGIVRGKSDRIDASRIADYGWKNRDSLKAASPINKVVFRLKNLVALRDKLVRDNAGYKTRVIEMKQCLGLTETDVLVKAQKSLVKEFEKKIALIEKEIKKTIAESPDVQLSYQLMTSIRGIGPVMATYMIAYTDNFTRFDNARQFACYIGIAPFPYQSGSSIRGKTKVSQLGLRKIKGIVHLCASSAIQNNPELKAYYQRRTATGKSKMSTLNIIRNKLISRIFAVVQRKTEYLHNYSMSHQINIKEDLVKS